MSQEYEIIAVVYHESGHALAALLNSMQVPTVVVKSTKLVSGSTEYIAANYNSEDKNLHREMLLAEIRVFYGGLAAEKIYYKNITGSNKFPQVLKHGSWFDISSITKIISSNKLVEPGSERKSFKNNLFKNISSDLEKYWTDVQLVAHSLYKLKKLEFKDLRKLLTKKSVNKDFWKEKFKNIDLIFHSKSVLNEKDVKKILIK